MNAVERMVEYTSQPTEGSAQALTQNPPQGWPHAGAITIDNLQVSLSHTYHRSMVTVFAENIFAEFLCSNSVERTQRCW